MVLDSTKRHQFWMEEISKIPRGSQNEKAISDFIVSFAKDHGLAWKQDKVWNVIVHKPASKGYEQVPSLALQAHTDMVCEKRPGSSHDFTKDPIELVVENGILRAKDTSLGADDGIGVAYMLAILEDESLPHPELYCLFTTMEEVGLLGALNLSKEDIVPDRLVTLDSVKEGRADLCAAGGCYVTMKKQLKVETNHKNTYRLKVNGLTGGHSGVDIHKERGNAIKLLGRVLEYGLSHELDLNLVSITGGIAENAIAREAEAVFTSTAELDLLEEVFAEIGNEIRAELESSDRDVSFELSLEETVETCFDLEGTRELLEFLYLLPDGFVHKSLAIEGLTVTSLNTGVVTTEGATVTLKCLIRSMFDGAVSDLSHQIELLSRLYGISFTSGFHFPGWSYAEISPLRDKYAKAMEDHGGKLEMVADHGGLEAGVFAGLHPGLDIITVGADCRYYHSFDEELDLESFDRVYDILCEIVTLCCED